MFIIKKKITLKRIFFYNYKHFFLNYEHLLPDRLALMHFIYSHKFSTCYLIFYRNGVKKIKNADKVGIKSRGPVGPWP